MNQETIKSVLLYDKVTGLFSWKVKRSGIKDKPTAGSFHKINGYIVICVNQKRYQAHRLAWLYEYGEIPNNQIDHIDGNRSNNAIENLRLATSAQNKQNIHAPRADCAHGHMGAAFDKRDGRWSAYIRKNGKSYYLGRFATGEEASEKYLQVKRELHEYCTI